MNQGRCSHCIKNGAKLKDAIKLKELNSDGLCFACASIVASQSKSSHAITRQEKRKLHSKYQGVPETRYQIYRKEEEDLTQVLAVSSVRQKAGFIAVAASILGWTEKKTHLVYRRILRRHGKQLQNSRGRVLKTLEEISLRGDAATINELCKKCDVSRSTVMRALKSSQRVKAVDMIQQQVYYVLLPEE